jgi:hypothetical protein
MACNGCPGHAEFKSESVPYRHRLLRMEMELWDGLVEFCVDASGNGRQVLIVQRPPERLIHQFKGNAPRAECDSSRHAPGEPHSERDFLLHHPDRMADEAKAEGFRGSKVEADSEKLLFAARLRFSPQSFGDGANVLGLVVARRSKMPDIRRSSLPDLIEAPEKIGCRRCRPIVLTGPSKTGPIEGERTRKLDHHVAISAFALQKSDGRHHRHNNQDVGHSMRQHVSYDCFWGFGESVMFDQLPYLLL